MNKEQQIEEMNKIMQEAFNNHCKNVRCVECPYDEMRDFYCLDYVKATALYNAGYKKLTTEQEIKAFGKLVFDPKDVRKCELPKPVEGIDLGDIFYHPYKETTTQELERVRKETAKEILNKVKERSVWFIENTIQKDHFNEQMQALAEKYGVEIEE